MRSNSPTSGKVIVRITQDERPDPSSPANLHFSVEDTGIGIAEDKLALIFESFEQVDTSYARKYGGSGLGLAICKQLVSLMGGKIWVESREGAGSTFHFAVPLTPSAMQIPTDEESAINTTGTNVNGLRLLVVDDNEVNRDVASLSLEQDHEVTTANNGLDALEKISAADFDAVFMDVQMPLMDGLNATSVIRSLEMGNRPIPRIAIELEPLLAGKLFGRHLPIMAMTAHAMGSDRDMCLKAGMDNYVTKPIIPGQLQQVLNEMFLPRRNAGSMGVARNHSTPTRAIVPTIEEIRHFLHQTTRLKEEQIDKILNSACQSMAHHLAAATQALRQKDTSTLARSCHTLKGTLLQCGLEEWADKAQAIYNGARENRDLPYAQLLEDLRTGLAPLLPSQAPY